MAPRYSLLEPHCRGYRPRVDVPMTIETRMRADLPGAMKARDT